MEEFHSEMVCSREYFAMRRILTGQESWRTRRGMVRSSYTRKGAPERGGISARSEREGIA